MNGSLKCYVYGSETREGGASASHVERRPGRATLTSWDVGALHSYTQEGWVDNNNKDEKKKSWKEVITSTDLTHNSCRAWQTIRKLYNDTTTPNPPCLVNSNQVAHQLLINGQGTMTTKPKRPILPHIQEGTPIMEHPFSEEEYKKGIAALKNNKAAGRDDVLVEQLKHLGQKANKWLHTMLNICFTGNEIPKIWRQSRIIAILKPGKDSEELQTNLPLMPYVPTLRTNDSKQNSPSS